MKQSKNFRSSSKNLLHMKGHHRQSAKLNQKQQSRQLRQPLTELTTSSSKPTIQSYSFSSPQPRLLKLKIKSLEQQIQLLQKSNLNIFIPISQKETQNTKQQNKDQIIKKLRIVLLKQQQQNQKMKQMNKILEKEKQTMKLQYENQLSKMEKVVEEVKNECLQLKEENDRLEEIIEVEKEKREKIQKEMIEIKVQLRFLNQDLQSYKTRYEDANKKYNSLKSQVLNVQFNSKIYHSHKVKITAIQTCQLNNLKNCIFELQRQIQQLLFKLANPKKQQKQQKIHLNLHTKNIGQQIVRLKRNIDMQLGFKGDDNVIKSFLQKYQKTNQRFKELIDGCKSTIV